MIPIFFCHAFNGFLNKTSHNKIFDLFKVNNEIYFYKNHNTTDLFNFFGLLLSLSWQILFHDIEFKKNLTYKRTNTAFFVEFL